MQCYHEAAKPQVLSRSSCSCSDALQRLDYYYYGYGVGVWEKDNGRVAEVCFGALEHHHPQRGSFRACEISDFDPESEEEGPV